MFRVKWWLQLSIYLALLSIVFIIQHTFIISIIEAYYGYGVFWANEYIPSLDWAESMMIMWNMQNSILCTQPFLALIELRAWWSCETSRKVFFVPNFS